MTPRQHRVVKHASRELDALEGVELSPLLLLDLPDDHWDRIGMSLGWVERDACGRDLALSGWAP